jgi:siroheme synthase
MGVKALPRITKLLVRYGLAPNTPAAVIQQGTTLDQRVIVNTLDKIAEAAKAAKIKSPAITIVGSVVDLSEPLAWFDEVCAEMPELVAI